MIYRLSAADFPAQRDELVELLELAPLIDKPVRNLSLGERMKAEFANSLVVTGAFCYTNMNMVQDLFTGRYRAGQYPTTTYRRGCGARSRT